MERLPLRDRMAGQEDEGSVLREHSRAEMCSEAARLSFGHARMEMLSIAIHMLRYETPSFQVPYEVGDMYDEMQERIDACRQWI